MALEPKRHLPPSVRTCTIAGNLFWQSSLWVRNFAAPAWVCDSYRQVFSSFVFPLGNLITGVRHGSTEGKDYSSDPTAGGCGLAAVVRGMWEFWKLWKFIVDEFNVSERQSDRHHAGRVHQRLGDHRRESAEHLADAPGWRRAGDRVHR